MNDKARAITGKHFIRMYDSLHQAVQNAGGTGASFTSKSLEEMTVIDLFGSLAQNGIRFYCCHTHKLVELPKSTVDPRNLTKCESEASSART